jgi:hypothetical protein
LICLAGELYDGRNLGKKGFRDKRAGTGKQGGFDAGPRNSNTYTNTTISNWEQVSGSQTQSEFKSNTSQLRYRESTSNDQNTILEDEHEEDIEYINDASNVNS